MENQENKMDKLLEIINSFCTVSIKSTEQLTNVICQMKDEMNNDKNERISQDTLISLTGLLRDDYAKQFKTTHEAIKMLSEATKQLKMH